MSSVIGFGYEYFDDPRGNGYRGYRKRSSIDQTPRPWEAALEFCMSENVTSVIDLGCAKGFLVEALLAKGIGAVGYDVSDYALSFAEGLPCQRHDVSEGVPGRADAVVALGVLMYLEAPDVLRTLEQVRSASDRFFVFSSYFKGDKQVVPDTMRRTTRSREWWRATITSFGFRRIPSPQSIDCYIVTSAK